MIADHVRVGIGESFYDPEFHRIYRVTGEKWHEVTRLYTIICDYWSLTGPDSGTNNEWTKDEFYRRLVGPARQVNVHVWNQWETGSPCSLYEVSIP